MRIPTSCLHLLSTSELYYYLLLPTTIYYYHYSEVLIQTFDCLEHEAVDPKSLAEVTDAIDVINLAAATFLLGKCSACIGKHTGSALQTKLAPLLERYKSFTDLPLRDSVLPHAFLDWMRLPAK